MSYTPAKRRRPEVPKASILKSSSKEADLAQIGLLPEQVSLALSQNARDGAMAKVVAGIDARTARAYMYVAFSLYEMSSLFFLSGLFSCML